MVMLCNSSSTAIAECSRQCVGLVYPMLWFCRANALVHRAFFALLASLFIPAYMPVQLFLFVSAIQWPTSQCSMRKECINADLLDFVDPFNNGDRVVSWMGFWCCGNACCSGFPKSASIEASAWAGGPKVDICISFSYYSLIDTLYFCCILSTVIRRTGVHDDARSYQKKQDKALALPSRLSSVRQAVQSYFRQSFRDFVRKQGTRKLRFHFDSSRIEINHPRCDSCPSCKAICGRTYVFSKEYTRWEQFGIISSRRPEKCTSNTRINRIYHSSKESANHLCSLSTIASSIWNERSF